MRIEVNLLIIAMIAGLLQSCDAGSTGFGLSAEESSETGNGEDQAEEPSNSEAGARRTSGRGNNSSSPDIIEPQDVVGAYLACVGTQTIDGVTYQCALHDSTSSRSLRPSVEKIDSVQAKNAAGNNLDITVESTDFRTADTADFIMTVTGPDAVALRTISARYLFKGGLKEAFLSRGKRLQPLRFGYMFRTREQLTGYEAQSSLAVAVCKQEAEAANLPGPNSFRPLLPSPTAGSILELLVGRDWYSTAMLDPLRLLSADAIATAAATDTLPILSATLDFDRDGEYDPTQNLFHWTFLTSPSSADYCTPRPGGVDDEAPVGYRYNPEDWLIGRIYDPTNHALGEESVQSKSCADRLPIICVSGPDIDSLPTWVDPSRR